jgi:hypothetical protein
MPVELYKTIQEKVLQYKPQASYYKAIVSLDELMHSKPLLDLIGNRM